MRSQLRSQQTLPIDAHLPGVLKTLESSSALVLVASPGAGKTTRVPAAILHSDLLAPTANGILMLEPRRLAARAAASRIAWENGYDLGRDVGYQVRFENRTSGETRLTVMTEGLLNRRLAHDPQLEGIGCVILDEFHERNWHSDIALGLLSELQQLARPDLKILVMSATLQAEPVSRFLGGAPVLEVGAPAHPIEVRHERDPQLLVTGPEFVERVASCILDVLAGRRPGEGHLLVFLPGTREIHGVASRLARPGAGLPTGIDVIPLHGSLRLEDQDRAVRPSQGRKVILATNIAETSLTIDGVSTVIDSGLARVLRQDAAGFPSLELSRISRFSMIQRTGRAGRQGPGVCHRLWNKMDEASMPESETPEIFRTDLAEACLLLASQGVGDLESFSWFERPPLPILRSARDLLIKLGAFEGSRTSPGSSLTIRLSELGRRLLDWPLHPRLARMMEEALSSGPDVVALAAQLAALVSERDPLTDAGAFRSVSALESDVLLRLEILSGRLGQKSNAVDSAAIASARRASEQIAAIAVRKTTKSGARARGHGKDDFETALQLLLLAFPDRVCRRRRPGEPDARMVGQTGVRLGRHSCVERSEFFIAVDVMAAAPGGPSTPARGSDRTVSQASRIEVSWLERLFPDQIRETRDAGLDPKSGRVMKRIVKSYDDLPLEEPRLAPADASDIERLLPDLVAAQWSVIITKNDSLRTWIERLEFLKAQLGERAWPDDDLRNARAPLTRKIIESACFGEKSPATLADKDLTWALEDGIGSEIAGLLKREAPETVTVPTGNRMRVHYPAGRAPYIEVRLQECFGLKESPRLACGKVQLTFHLLGPNYRPVQVTSDLSGFWAGSYAEVRKELRARYPKHSWPEDPANAPPEAKGRRRS